MAAIYRHLVEPELAAAMAGTFRGRKVLMVGDVLAGLSSAVPLFTSLGSELRVIAGVAGEGETAAVDHRVLGGTNGSIMEGIWAFERALGSLPEDVMGWLDLWDPMRQAVVIASTHGDLADVGGRRVYGARRPEWGALEDKTVIDGTWDLAGIRRAPREVVPVAVAPGVHRAFGGESVWVADNRDGWHGGADRVRWVSSDDHLDQALAFFSGVADRVRVMPFLEGVPCSIHGYVLPGRVLAFRPVELLMLRDRAAGRFVYGSVATTWDPHPADREEMRQAARMVGAHLHGCHGYLGGFSMDGVMTSDGFRPTELNPRLSAGLGVQWGGVSGEYPLGLMTRMLVEGDLDPGWFEGLEEPVVAFADGHRVGRVVLGVPDDLPAEEVTVRFVGERLVEAGGPDAATLRVGRGPSGSTIAVVFDDLPGGERFGPRALAVSDFASARWGLDMGRLEAAPDVRRR